MTQSRLRSASRDREGRLYAEVIFRSFQFRPLIRWIYYTAGRDGRVADRSGPGDPMNITIMNDEVSADFESSLELVRSGGLEAIETRRAGDRRYPDVGDYW